MHENGPQPHEHQVSSSAASTPATDQWCDDDFRLDLTPGSQASNLTLANTDDLTKVLTPAKAPVPAPNPETMDLSTPNNKRIRVPSPEESTKSAKHNMSSSDDDDTPSVPNTVRKLTYSSVAVTGVRPVSAPQAQQHHMSPDMQQYIFQCIQNQMSAAVPFIIDQVRTQLATHSQAQVHQEVQAQVQAAISQHTHNNDEMIQLIQGNLSQLQIQIQAEPMNGEAASDLACRIELVEQSITCTNVRYDDQMEGIQQNAHNISQVDKQVQVKVRDLEQRLTKVEKTAERAEQQCMVQGASCSAAAASTLARVQQLTDQQQQQQQQNTREQNPATMETEVQGNTEETSIFIKGVKRIRAFFHSRDSNNEHNWQNADPAAVVSYLFGIVGAQSAIQRMIMADIRSAGSRQEVDSVVVRMSSIYQKKSAIFRIRNYIYRTELSTLMLADCYPQQQMERARALVRYCGYLKEQGTITGYSVSNWRGVPDTQTYYDKGGWQRMEVDEDTLQPFYMAKDDRDDDQPPVDQQVAVLRGQQQQTAASTENMDTGNTEPSTRNTAATKAAEAALARATPLGAAGGSQRGSSLGAVGRGRGGGREASAGGATGGPRGPRVYRGRGGYQHSRGRPYAAPRGQFATGSRVTSPNNTVMNSSNKKADAAAVSQARKAQLMYEGKRAEIEELKRKADSDKKRIAELQAALGRPPTPHHNQNQRNVHDEDEGEDL